MGILKNTFIGLLSVVIFLTGCIEKPETNVSPDRIYTSYGFIYDETINQTLAKAVFSADTREGWHQELSGSAKVDFEDEELVFNDPSDEYLFLFDDLLAGGDFTYYDQNGSTYVNHAELKFFRYPSGLDSINVNSDFEFQWGGGPLEEGESVTLVLADESSTIIGTITQDEIGKESIVIPKNEFSPLGTVAIRMIWEKQIPTDQDPGVGGEVYNAVFLQPISVVFYRL